jgi:oxygen-independent coproporphyrinogen-3 oxidase
MQIEMLDDNVRYDDTVTTALRTSEGIYLKRLKPIYYDFILENSKNYIKNGLLSIKDGHLILTRKGIHISDYIMSDLMFI